MCDRRNIFTSQKTFNYVSEYNFTISSKSMKYEENGYTTTRSDKIQETCMLVKPF